MLRLHEPLDVAAAAVHARCLQTSPNNGCRTARCVCNGANNKLLGTITRLILSWDPQKKRTTHAQFGRYGLSTKKTRRNPSSSPRGCPTLCDTKLALRMEPLQPLLRCRQRHSKCHCDLLVADASGCHLVNGDEFRCTSRTFPHPKCL